MNVEQQQHQYLGYQPEWLVDDPEPLQLGEPSSSPATKKGTGKGGKKDASRISLADLKDCPPGVKPYHAYSTLIRYAIKGSPQGEWVGWLGVELMMLMGGDVGKLLLEDIYEALMLRFEYFRNAPPGWKVHIS